MRLRYVAGCMWIRLATRSCCVWLCFMVGCVCVAKTGCGYGWLYVAQFAAVGTNSDLKCLCGRWFRGSCRAAASILGPRHLLVAPVHLLLTRAHSLFNLTLTQSHTHTLLITCTCCYDEIKGTQDQDFSCSFSDSLSSTVPLRLTLTLRVLVCDCRVYLCAIAACWCDCCVGLSMNRVFNSAVHRRLSQVCISHGPQVLCTHLEVIAVLSFGSALLWQCLDYSGLPWQYPDCSALLWQYLETLCRPGCSD